MKFGRPPAGKRSVLVLELASGSSREPCLIIQRNDQASYFIQSAIFVLLAYNRKSWN
jgi:hypothetical protein